MTRFRKLLISLLITGIVGSCSPDSKSEDQPSPTPTQEPVVMTKGMTTEELLNKGVSAGDETTAIKYYDEALKMEANDPLIYDMRATAYQTMAGKLCSKGCEKGTPDFQQQLDYYNKAIADYTKALEIDNWFEGAYRSRGNVYLLIGDYEKAITDFSQVLSLSPDNADILNNRSIAFIYSKKYELAMADITKAIELKPDPGFFTARSRVFREMKQYDLALDDANEALALKPGFAGGFYSRGLVYKLQNNCPKANEDFKQACSIAPDSEACTEVCK